MDGASWMPPEALRELERLRARAYGPHADIERDPAAQRRLRALEERRHGGDVVDAALLVLSRDTHVRRTLDRWRGWGEACVAVAAAGAAATVAIAGVLLLTPGSGRVLAPVEADAQQRQDFVDALDLETFEMGGSLLQRFEALGDLDIWTTRARNGEMVCLLVRGGITGLRGAACAPPPLHPIVQVTGDDSSVRGVLRLTENGAGIDVEVVAPG